MLCETNALYGWVSSLRLMTRMWCVLTEILCNDHLRGEHAEHHQLVGTIHNHPHGEAIAVGHAEKGNIDTTRLEERHAQLATEMERRGMNHDSPLSYDSPTYGAGERRERSDSRFPDFGARLVVE